jgi:hypothetical protein
VMCSYGAQKLGNCCGEWRGISVLFHNWYISNHLQIGFVSNPPPQRQIIDCLIQISYLGMKKPTFMSATFLISEYADNDFFKSPLKI